MFGVSSCMRPSCCTHHCPKSTERRIGYPIFTEDRNSSQIMQKVQPTCCAEQHSLERQLTHKLSVMLKHTGEQHLLHCSNTLEHTSKRNQILSGSLFLEISS